MKNKIYLLIIVFVGLSISSCNDDFFDTTSDTDLTEDNYWTSADDYRLVLNGLYTFYTGHSTKWTNSPIVWGDKLSDNLVPDDVEDYVAGNYTVPSTDASYTYTTVRTINTLLEAAEENTAGLTDAELTPYIAEAKFFKAEFYFQKVKRYGNYSWLDDVLTEDSEELYEARTDRDEVMDSVLSCINYAIENLTNDDTDNNGYINVNMALAAKSRMMLYEGTYRKYHDDGDYTDYLQASYDASLELMESGDYSLESDYATLFGQIDKTASSECILIKNYEYDLLTTGTNFMLSYNQPLESVSKSMVNQYLCSDGLPISQSTLFDESGGWTTEFDNRDSRLSASVAGPDATMLYGKYPNIEGAYVSSTETPDIQNSLWVAPSGYVLTKHYQFNSADSILAQLGALDAIIYRYGEVLLNYAEAASELGTLTQDDIDISINLLRARAGMPDMTIADLVKDEDSDFPDISATLDEIRRERRVELAFENFRHDDLMRWYQGDLLEDRLLGFKLCDSNGDILSAYEGVYDNVDVSTDTSSDADIYVDSDGYIWPYATDLPDGRSFSTKFYLYPIPTDELTLNENLTQNPGW
jgi:hypothetical protein